MAPASSGQGGGPAGPAGAVRAGGQGRGGERQGRPEERRSLEQQRRSLADTFKLYPFVSTYLVVFL